MDVPDLVAKRLGGEQARAVVALEDDDRAVFTPTRTLVYRAESLLRDATVEAYGHDIQRLSLSVGRRRTEFTVEYVDGRRQFTVPNDSRSAVLEHVLHGALEAADVLDDGEGVRAVYRFSDLTVVITDARLVKHVGQATWNAEYEEYPFAAVTGLEFEEGDVATQVVLWVDGRAERIKAPNDEAPVLRQTLVRALLEFHGADSLDVLNERLAPDDESAPHASLALDDDIAPLIESSGDDDPPETDTESPVTTFELGPDAEPLAGADDPAGDEPAEPAAGSTDTARDRTPEERPDIARLEQQLADLKQVVERQNELIERQSRHISELARHLDEHDRE